MDEITSKSAKTSPQFDPEQLRTELEPNLRPPDPAELAEHARQATVQAQSRAAVCGAMTWCAFSAPAATTAIYDAIANGVLDATLPDSDADVDSLPLPEAFWEAYASVLTGPEDGYDASSITIAVASLAAAVHDEFPVLAESAASSHPGARGVAEKPVPELLSLENLATCPEDSLGRTLYRMLVDNGFDPEVLDREAIGLAGLSPALRYLNTRILQMHDVWHLLAGYQTTSLHEIAISAFQLAQFGHNYSGMFLATVATKSHLGGGLGFEVLLRTIAEAWLHGRSTIPFMDIEFEAHWQQPIHEIRKQFDITPYSGTYPADLFEQLASMDV